MILTRNCKFQNVFNINRNQNLKTSKLSEIQKILNSILV